MKAFLTIAFVAGIVVDFALTEPALGVDNVCTKTEFIPIEKLVKKPVIYKMTVDSMCGIFPCKKTITETRTNTSREVVFKEVEKRTCCDGYAETPERTCAPICLKPCQSGTCVGPNLCECNPKPSEASPGFAGPTCNRFVCLKINKWGQACDRECDCRDTAFCDARSGKCVCRPGWRGSNCTEECDSRSSCDDIVIPTFFEPEVNIIKTDDNISGRMSALSLESSDNRENESDEKRAFSKILMAHMQINLLLMLLTICLVFAMFWYKKKLAQLRNEIYYTVHPGASSGGSESNSYSSVYSAPSAMTGRPRMPTPDEAAFFNKNISFDSATRNAVTEKDMNQPLNTLHIQINKAERHLIASKEVSAQNIYSDIESNFDNQSNSKEHCMKIDTNLLRVQDESDYQVPRSPTRNIDRSNADIYEEIAPNLPAKAEL